MIFESLLRKHLQINKQFSNVTFSLNIDIFKFLKREPV